MKVIPLGVSSGRPTATRGLSALAIVMDGRFVLFDCGEGTQWQLAKLGLKPTSRLDSVFITHLHGDHITGLPGLLGTMTLESRAEPIDLFGPVGLRDYLEQMRRLGLVRPHYPLRIHEVEGPGLLHEGPGYRVHTDELVHRLRAWGYRFEEHDRPGRFDAGKAEALGVPGPLRKRLVLGEAVTMADGQVIEPSAVVGPKRRGLVVAYCTDTVKCEGAVRLARNADLLVHESTFASDRKEEAFERGHSTSVDAAEVSVEANAARLLLTHFSPRYDDLQPLLDEARAVRPEGVELAVELQAVELTPPG